MSSYKGLYFKREKYKEKDISLYLKAVFSVFGYN